MQEENNLLSAEVDQLKSALVEAEVLQAEGQGTCHELSMQAEGQGACHDLPMQAEGQGACHELAMARSARHLNTRP